MLKGDTMSLEKNTAKLLTRILCWVLALLMVSGAVATILSFLL